MSRQMISIDGIDVQREWDEGYSKDGHYSYIKGEVLEKSFVSPLPDPSEDFAAKELEERIYRTIDSLPATQSQVMQLRADGLSYKEIASAIGSPVTTVRPRLSRARKRIKEQNKGLLQEYGVR